jgi:flagellar hook-associated protein FlgK
MASTTSIAISGMSASLTAMNASADNIANADTRGFHRQQVFNSEQAGGGVSASVSQAGAQGPAMEQDVVAQLQARNAFLANLAVFKSANQMAGALLREKA